MNDERIAVPEAPARAHRLRAALLREVKKVYVGADDTIEILAVTLLSRGHALLEGVPGIAKTTLVKAFAATLGCSFRRIQFTPDLLPADITGTYVAHMPSGTFELRRGPIFAQIVLGDEINRAPAKTQSALLEAMQEGQVTIEGHTHRLTPPFMVLATQNPIEQEGVYPLPEAQLDRFSVKIELGYPTAAEERRILATHGHTPPHIEPVLNPQAILQLAEAAEHVHVEAELVDYVIGLARHTRAHPDVLHGASPRAALMLYRCARCLALLRGRAYVLPDDIRWLAPYVFTHRIQMTPEAELEGARPADVVADAIASVPYARS